MKLEYGKSKRAAICKAYDPRPLQLRQTSDSEVVAFVAQLKSHAATPAFLHVIPDPVISSLSQSTAAPVPLPPISRSSIAKVQHLLKVGDQPPSIENIKMHCSDLVKRLAPTQEDAALIEKATV